MRIGCGRRLGGSPLPRPPGAACGRSAFLVWGEGAGNCAGTTGVHQPAWVPPAAAEPRHIDGPVCQWKCDEDFEVKHWEDKFDCSLDQFHKLNSWVRVSRSWAYGKQLQPSRHGYGWATCGTQCSAGGVLLYPHIALSQQLGVRLRPSCRRPQLPLPHLVPLFPTCRPKAGRGSRRVTSAMW